MRGRVGLKSAVARQTGVATRVPALAPAWLGDLAERSVGAGRWCVRRGRRGCRVPPWWWWTTARPAPPSPRSRPRPSQPRRHTGPTPITAPPSPRSHARHSPAASLVVSGPRAVKALSGVCMCERRSCRGPEFIACEFRRQTRIYSRQGPERRSCRGLEPQPARKRRALAERRQGRYGTPARCSIRSRAPSAGVPGPASRSSRERLARPGSWSS